LWQADPQNVTLIDVRTPEEYVFVGHPEMAWSIPVRFNVVESDGEYGALTMKQNATFVTEVKKIAQQEDTIMVICRSGSRSAAAANLLVEAGFQRVFNIVDGVEGDKVDDPESVFHGKRMKNGWKNAGLPWTYDVVQGRMRLSQESAN
jgi:rhodanese-related sulfurtransferase